MGEHGQEWSPARSETSEKDKSQFLSETITHTYKQNENKDKDRQFTQSQAGFDHLREQRCTDHLESELERSTNDTTRLLTEKYAQEDAMGQTSCITSHHHASIEQLHFHIRLLYCALVCVTTIFVFSGVFFLYEMQAIKHQLYIANTTITEYHTPLPFAYVRNLTEDNAREPDHASKVLPEYDPTIIDLHKEERETKKEMDKMRKRRDTWGPAPKDITQDSWAWMSTFVRVPRSSGERTYKGIPVSVLQAYCQQSRSYCNAHGPPGLPGERGEKGEKGEQEMMTHQKAIRGPPGPKGDRGEQGPTGPKGDMGFPGRHGTNGPPGEKGDRGHRGYPGEEGRGGMEGRKGDRGLPGPKGERGQGGLPGVPGYKGIAGEQGPPGVRGYQGHRGYKGEPGVCEAHQCVAVEITRARQQNSKSTRNASSTVMLYFPGLVLSLIITTLFNKNHWQARAPSRVGGVKGCLDERYQQRCQASKESLADLQHNRIAHLGIPGY